MGRCGPMRAMAIKVLLHSTLPWPGPGWIICVYDGRHWRDTFHSSGWSPDHVLDNWVQMCSVDRIAVCGYVKESISNVCHVSMHALLELSRAADKTRSLTPCLVHFLASTRTHVDVRVATGDASVRAAVCFHGTVGTILVEAKTVCVWSPWSLPH